MNKNERKSHFYDGFILVKYFVFEFSVDGRLIFWNFTIFFTKSIYVIFHKIVEFLEWASSHHWQYDFYVP